MLQSRNASLHKSESFVQTSRFRYALHLKPQPCCCISWLNLFLVVFMPSVNKCGLYAFIAGFELEVTSLDIEKRKPFILFSIFIENNFHWFFIWLTEFMCHYNQQAENDKHFPLTKKRKTHTRTQSAEGGFEALYIVRGTRWKQFLPLWY